MRIRGEAGRTRAFTLLEIMVAVAVVAIMMTFLLTIFVGTMRLRRRTEEVTEMNARARAAFDLLRRDLQGAFPLADELPSPTGRFADYQPGEEFLWEAPHPTIPGAFRRISFVTAMDGGRTGIKVENPPGSGTYVDLDPFRPYEHAVISWVVRGGALYRQTCPLKISVTSADKPSNWEFNPPGASTTGTGVQITEAVYSDMSRPFDTVDVYRWMPFIQTWPGHATSTTVPDKRMHFKMDNNGTEEAVPVNVVVCIPSTRSAPLPGWLDKFTQLTAAGAPRTVTAGALDYNLYSKPCPEGAVYLGPNTGAAGDLMYFVILEPLWWSLGEDAEDLVFLPSVAPTDPDGNGVFTGPVPEYLDVTLTISDPEHPTGRRVFGERMWIPAGGGM